MQLPPPPLAWKKFLHPTFPNAAWDALTARMQTAYEHSQVYPDSKDVWNALEAVPPEKVRVILLGQDPYHGAGQAHGFAFSVPVGQPTPPSLRNILKEYCADTGYSMPYSGDLRLWAEEGVLLLNTAFTVNAGMPGSHSTLGYGPLVQAMLYSLAADKPPKAFWFWGRHAQKAAYGLPANQHLILESAHPSPLGAYRGFCGSKPFSKTNQFFAQTGEKSINWCLEGLPLPV
jgi:uracil-DNA glycosylase